jgi:Ca-activated chloride channel family protein
MKIRIVISTLICGALLAGCAPAERANNAGNRALQGGSPDTALEQYFNAQVIRPDAPVPHYNALIALEALGESDRAAAHGEQALESGMDVIAPIDGLYNLGYAYFQAGRYHDAVLTYRELLRRNPDDAEARYNYELALMNDVAPTPENQQQQTEPQSGQTDPETTPTDQPNAPDGPTPTPPVEDNPPDLTPTPEGGSGDFADDVRSTPQPRSGGPVSVEEARTLFDEAAREQRSLSEYLKQAVSSGEPEENDW